MSDQTTPIENVELPPVYVPISANIPQADYENMRELGRIYGMRYAASIITQAFRDALEHVNCPSSEELADLRSRLDELENENGDGEESELEDGEESELEDGEEDEFDEGEEEPSPYDRETIDYFKGLNTQGKKFLSSYLKGNPNSRNVGRLSTTEREIIGRVNTLCHFDGRRQNAPACRENRKNLFIYLQEQGILP